jgi:acyl-CoA thioesterase FadM
MVKIEIEMIENFIFETDLLIRKTDIRYDYVSLIHEARVRFLESFGFSEANIDGKKLIVIDLAISYKSQSFHGDLLKFEIGVANFTKDNFNFYYKVTNTKTGNLFFLAKTGIAFFDFSQNKIVNTPEVFLGYFLEKVQYPAIRQSEK